MGFVIFAAALFLLVMWGIGKIPERQAGWLVAAYKWGTVAVLIIVLIQSCFSGARDSGYEEEPAYRGRYR